MSYSINLYLDKLSSKKNISEKELQIFLYLRSQGRTIKIYVERKCTKKQWDNSKQRVNPRYYKSGPVELNKYLDNVCNETGKIFEENNNSETETTKSHLKKMINRLNNRENNVLPSITFEDIFEEFIKNSSITKQQNTIKQYRNTLNHLKKFSSVRGITLAFEKIDLEFQDCLKEYFIRDLKLTHNTVAKNIKNLKTFLNYSTDREYNRTLTYKKFDDSEKQTEIYTLTVDELMKMFFHTFKEDHLEKIKDVFCFSCFTGLRFSDVANLRRENIFDNQIRIIIKKTQETTKIPLNEYALSILNKYATDKNPLPVISSQKTNEYLKEIGKQVQLNEPVRIVKYIGNEIFQKVVSKHEVLTFHVARKTFITSCLVLGMNERLVRDFSGHKKDESFRRYVKFADSFRDRMMNETWNKSNLERSMR